MRPLSPLPIALGSAALAGLLSLSHRLDDLIDAALVVWVAQMFVWLGSRGPSLDRSELRRALLAVGSAVPTAALWIALAPWVSGDRMYAVAATIVIGGPIATVASAFVIWFAIEEPQAEPLSRPIAIAGVTTALAWLLSLVMFARGDQRDGDWAWLAFPGIATWWLVLPWAELRARRRARVRSESSR